MSGFMKTVLKNEDAPKASVFLSPETLSKRRRYIIKRKVSVFSPSPPVYLAFTVVLSLFLAFYMA